MRQKTHLIAVSYCLAIQGPSDIELITVKHALPRQLVMKSSFHIYVPVLLMMFTG